MKPSFMAGIFLSSLSFAVIAKDTSMKGTDQRDDVAAIDQLFRDYLDLQNKDDMDAIATRIYRPPVLSLYANKVYTSSAELSAAWKAYLGKPGQDGRQRAIASIQTCVLSKTVAISAVDFLVPVDGKEGTAKRPWFYTLQKADGRWRIVSLSPRDPMLSFACATGGR